jgi:hypothetical protein
MRQFRLSDSIDLLNLPDDVFRQLLRRFFALVIDFHFDEQICTHPLAVH